MKNIKIFVSHRIDKNSKTLDNELFIPIRCGAIYDESNNPHISLGDDTGDNISKKRMSFNELTVQYWAWKNQEADYYGLCHYRRYLSFSNIYEPKANLESNNGCISINDISEQNIEKFGLNKDIMQREIEKYDAIFIEPINLDDLKIKNNYTAMKNSSDYHNIKDVDKVIEIIKIKYPTMSKLVDEYMFYYKYSYLYNCFIMKKDLFMEYSSWLFDILFELETQIDMSTYTTKQYRGIGTIAERLLGIYILYLERQNKYKIKHNSLLFIEDTNIEKPLYPAFEINNIPIVSNFNKDYIPIFTTFLISFLEVCNPNNNYDFILIVDDITVELKKIILNFIKDYKYVSIRFCSSNKILDHVDTKIHHDCYTKDLYYRIIIPYLLNDYDKVIVIDADTICRKDLALLYNIEINDYLLAAVKDTVMQGYLNGMRKKFLSYLTNKLKLSNPYNYVNTGVILLNCKLFRETYSENYIIDYISKNIQSVLIYEQDMLNKLCDNRILFIDQRWNYYAQTSKFISDCIALSTMQCCQIHHKIQNSPYVIHYAASPKPWQSCAGEYSTLWWQYARKTPFYELILKRMMEHAIWEEASLIKNNRKNCLKYWKYKILRNFVFGKTRERYIYKKNAYKEKIRQAKKIIKE